MSFITSLIVTVSHCDLPKIEQIDAWLSEAHAGYVPLAHLNNSFSGYGPCVSDVFGAGYNHFPAGQFTEFLATLGWFDPGGVVIVMLPEEGAASVWRPAR